MRAKLSNRQRIVGSDASKGLKGACQELEVKPLPATHSHSEYTPALKISKKLVLKAALQAMRASSMGTVPMHLGEGGDHQNGCRRPRHRVIGVQNPKKLAPHGQAWPLRRAATPLEHVDSLAALFCSETPGLDAFLMAVALHRKHMQDAVSPASMYTDLTLMYWDDADAQQLQKPSFSSIPLDVYALLNVVKLHTMSATPRSLSCMPCLQPQRC